MKNCQTYQSNETLLVSMFRKQRYRFDTSDSWLCSGQSLPPSQPSGIGAHWCYGGANRHDLRPHANSATAHVLQCCGKNTNNDSK